MTDPRLQAVPAGSLDGFTSRGGLALVELWAPWSGLSVLMRSVVDRVLLRRPDLPVRVGRVDVSEAPELLARLGLAGPPALLVFRGGEVVARHGGLITPDALERWIEAAAGGRPGAPGANEPLSTE